MRTRTSLWALLSAFFLLAEMSAAANFTVEAQPNNRFSPQNLTIQAGDSVTWTNAGGNHNVAANDGSFRCANGCDGQGGNGNPSTAAWSFSLTFNDPGVIDYLCEVHGGLGMVGSITVQQQEVPGDLRFAQASRQVNEGAGSVRLTVQRAGGDDGAVSVDYATSDGSAQAGSDYTPTSGTLTWIDGDDDPKTFDIPILDDTDDEGNETINVALSSPTGGAGLGSPSTATVTIRDDDDSVPSPGNLGFSASSFEGDEGTGSVAVTVERTGGTDGAVSVDYATSDGSAAAGSDYVAAAGTLSWADGDGASKELSVEILDDALEEGNETVNLSLSSPTGGAGLGTSSATLTIRDDDRTVVPCVADAETLCLNRDGRFRAQIEWRDFAGNSGPGQTVDIGKRDSGLFFFFDENNIEMLIKVLDACVEPFNHFWVFYAATTNVEFTLTVTDTARGIEKRYTNELGTPAPPVLDTSAFATCP
jgi:plastocyanin